VETSVKVVRDGDAVRHLLLNERDVTEIKYQREAQSLQARFRGVLDAAPDAFVLVDQQGRIALVNPEAERLFGYSSQELLGRAVELLVPDRFHVHHPTHRSNYFGDPHTRPMGSGVELSARRKDGSEFFVEISLSPLLVEGVTLAIAAIRDVSARKKNEAKFRALLEAAPDAMVIVNQDGRIALINSQAERLFGHAREELLDQPVEILVPLHLRDHHPAHRLTYFAGPKPRPMGAGLELRGRRRDGTEFPVEISLSPVETEDGTLVIAAIRDISERIRFDEVRREVAERTRTEIEIRRLNEDLERRVAERTGELAASNRELEAFTYSVSHDLRAPLRQIDGFSRILSEETAGSLSAKGQHCVQRIREGTQHMGRLVDDLLNLAQVGRQHIQPRLVELQPVVDEVVADLQSELVGCEVEWKIHPLPAVYFDPGLLKVVFANLLSNAVKYTRGRTPVVIEVDQMTQDGLPVFLVRDNGVGFDMRFADMLFGVFQRLHHADQFEGTGVGLATVQRIIHKHGGRIWAEAEIDKGATFYFTIGSKVPTPVAREE
jgi:PAS domain S-box-containing protein